MIFMKTRGINRSRWVDVVLKKSHQKILSFKKVTSRDWHGFCKSDPTPTKLFLFFKHIYTDSRIFFGDFWVEVITSNQVPLFWANVTHFGAVSDRKKWAFLKVAAYLRRYSMDSFFRKTEMVSNIFSLQFFFWGFGFHLSHNKSMYQTMKSHRFEAC